MEFLKKNWILVLFVTLLFVRPAYSIIPIRPSVIPHALYAYATRSNEVYTITKTHSKINPNSDVEEYLVWAESIGNGKRQEFTVADTFFYFNFKSSRLWGNIEEGKSYRITSYGWRMGLFSTYPNIVAVQPIEQ